jgi:hypothetical protein
MKVTLSEEESLYPEKKVTLSGEKSLIRRKAHSLQRSGGSPQPVVREVGQGYPDDLRLL